MVIAYYMMMWVVVLAVGMATAFSPSGKLLTVIGSSFLFFTSLHVGIPALPGLTSLVMFGAILATIDLSRDDRLSWGAMFLTLMVGLRLCMLVLAQVFPTIPQADGEPVKIFVSLVFLIGWFILRHQNYEAPREVYGAKAVTLLIVGLPMAAALMWLSGARTRDNIPELFATLTLSIGFAVDTPVWVWLGCIVLGASGVVNDSYGPPVAVIQTCAAMMILGASIWRHFDERMSSS